MIKTPGFVKPLHNLSRLALVTAFLSIVIAVRAATTNFFANFESTSGYTAGTALDGQNTWVGFAVDTDGTYDTPAGANGNGVIAGGLGGSGQAAYVGLTPLPASHDAYLDLWADFPFDPVANGTPIVKFSAKVKINDSSNDNYDYFYFYPANIDGLFLFGIVFDVYYEQVYPIDDNGGSPTNYTTFAPGVEYSLLVTMNFGSNTYSASLTNLSTMTGSTFISSLPITVAGSSLTLDSMDALWQPYDPANPGNNQMVFDDYLVTSEPQTLPPPSKPTLGVSNVTPGGPATIRLTGEDGYQFALDVSTNLTSWLPLATNTVSGGYADFIDPGAASSSSRFYRARWVQ